MVAFSFAAALGDKLDSDRRHVASLVWQTAEPDPDGTIRPAAAVGSADAAFRQREIESRALWVRFLVHEQQVTKDFVRPTFAD